MEINLGSTNEDLKKLLRKLKRAWGMLFRTFFIGAIAFICYIIFEPKSIGDIPFSQLTFNMIFSNILGFAFVIGCIIWLFKFPQKGGEWYPSTDPYIAWANVSGYFLLIIIFIWAWLHKN